MSSIEVDYGNSGKAAQYRFAILIPWSIVVLVVAPHFVSDPVQPVVANRGLLGDILFIGIPVQSR